MIVRTRELALAFEDRLSGPRRKYFSTLRLASRVNPATVQTLRRIARDD
jgi:hypothetical protein